MKKIKTITLLMIITFMLSIFGMFDVNAAFPDDFVLVRSSDKTLDSGGSGGNYYLKYTNLTHTINYFNSASTEGHLFALCTSAPNAYTTNGHTYAKSNSNWENEKRVAIAQLLASYVPPLKILSNGNIENVENLETVWMAQQTLWQYLGQTTSGQNQEMRSKMDNAVNYYNDSIKFDDGTTSQNLNFNLSGDKYVSQKINVKLPSLGNTKEQNDALSKIVKSTVTTVVTSNNNIHFTVTGDENNGYIVSFLANELDENQIVNVALKITQTRNFKMANNYYDTQASDQQTLTIPYFSDETDTKTIIATGTITGTEPVNPGTPDEKMYDIYIKKLGENSKNLSGASFKVVMIGGSSPEYTWKSSGKNDDGQKLELVAGQYKLIEVEAPSGYFKTNDITFVVEAGGKVLLSGSNPENVAISGKNTIIVVNDKDPNAEEVNVPNTGIKNTIIIVLGVLFALGGMTFLAYGVYKNKKNSEI